MLFRLQSKQKYARNVCRGNTALMLRKHAKTRFNTETSVCAHVQTDLTKLSLCRRLKKREAYGGSFIVWLTAAFMNVQLSKIKIMLTYFKHIS